MEVVELSLDKETLARARVIAQTQSRSLEELIAEIINSLGALELTNDPVLGLFARDVDLMDQIVETAMQSREAHSLRSA